MANLHEPSTAFGGIRVFHQQVPPKYQNNTEPEKNSDEYKFSNFGQPIQPIERHQVSTPLEEKPNVASSPSLESLTYPLQDLKIATNPPLAEKGRLIVKDFLQAIRSTPIFTIPQFEWRIKQPRTLWLDDRLVPHPVDGKPTTSPRYEPPPRINSLPRTGWNHQPPRTPRRSFLTLPGEIRNIIYEICLVRGHLPFVSIPHQKHNAIGRRSYFQEVMAPSSEERGTWHPDLGPEPKVESPAQYQLASVSSPPYILAFKGRQPEPSGSKGTDAFITEILCLNRQIYQEALPFLYSNNTFEFESVTMPCEWSDHVKRNFHMLYRQGEKIRAIKADQWQSSRALQGFLSNLSPKTSAHIERLYLHADSKSLIPFDIFEILFTNPHLKILTLDFAQKSWEPLSRLYIRSYVGQINRLKKLTIVCLEDEANDKWVRSLANVMVENYDGQVTMQKKSKTDMKLKIWFDEETYLDGKFIEIYTATSAKAQNGLARLPGEGLSVPPGKRPTRSPGEGLSVPLGKRPSRPPESPLNKPGKNCKILRKCVR